MVSLAFLIVIIGLFKTFAIPTCPYIGNTIEVSKTLSECLDVTGTGQFSLNKVISCFTRLVPSGQANNKAIYFENNNPSNTVQEINKEDYLPCAKEFDKLLNIIMIERGEHEKEVNKMKEAAENRKKMTKKQIVEDSIKYQNDICNGKVQYFTKEKDEKVKSTQATFQGASFTMNVHAEGDAVSSLILKWKAWEYKELQAVGTAMEKYMKSKNINDPSQLTFIDVGAQVGWYAMNIASKGYKVIAFEPFIDNEYVVRKNICANPKFKITFVNAALGEEEKTCYLYSENNNRDDPGILCDAEMVNPKFFNRGATEVYKLDDFADLIENVVAIKMDIEGFEYKLIRGGRKVILERKVPYIMSEFSPQMLGERGDNALAYLKEYINAGYKVSNTDFTSGFLNDQQIEQLSKIKNIANIFFTHQDVLKYIIFIYFIPLIFI